MNEFSSVLFANEGPQPRSVRRIGKAIDDKEAARRLYIREGVRADRPKVFVMKDGSITPARYGEGRMSVTYEGFGTAVETDLTVNEMADFSRAGLERAVRDEDGHPDHVAMAAHIADLAKQFNAGKRDVVHDLAVAVVAYLVSSEKGYLLLLGEKSWASLVHRPAPEQGIDIQSGCCLVVTAPTTTEN